MFVIGLGHRARHGKDTVARAIVRDATKQGWYAKQYAFADALKAYCRVAFGMREKDAPLLQYMGTNVFRKTDPGIWVRVLLDTIEEQQPDVAVISDMRFPNEADAIKALGGYTMCVERRREDGSLWVATDRDPNHPSEIAMEGYPFDERIIGQDGQVNKLITTGIYTFRALFDKHTMEAT
jgi:hypothetical protein